MLLPQQGELVALFHLTAFSDNEIELITEAINLWAERNHIDVQSDHGRRAMAQAIALVSSGSTSPEAIAGRLDQVCATPLAPLSQGLADSEESHKT